MLTEVEKDEIKRIADKASKCPVGKEGHYAHYGCPICDTCWQELLEALEQLKRL